jgi:hypothetical protein
MEVTFEEVKASKKKKKKTITKIEVRKQPPAPPRVIPTTS